MPRRAASTSTASCQTTDSLRFGPIGIGSEPAEVHTVNYKDIAAVVSDTPLEVYDPTRENVLAHERVNEAVMRDFTVIPMSFNTVFKTREDIVELLRTAYDAFRDVLGKMEDKLEFGLKVVWEPEIVIREIEKENENVRLLREQISSQKGSTYFARMQYGRLVDSLLQERSERLVAEIFQALCRRLGRLARQQAHRRQDDLERGLPRAARPRVGFRRQGQGDRRQARQPEAQVHRPLAAVQLRQHPAEARAGDGGRVIILDRLLVGGISFVLDKIASAVDDELNDDERLRTDLLEAQMQVELGEISEADFAALEAEILLRLQEIRERRTGAAAGALSFGSGAEVEVSFGGEEQDPDER